ncbi:MAG TPA: hypothetical protein VFQ05_12585, partial [Candidatus Eisenbacteria bacterium]|nr:hypothetical protein [Candidatus Eisenbacteria bacterium]
MRASDSGIETRVAAAIVLAFLGVAAVVNGLLHSVPLYGTETDLVGEYIPAALELQSGVVSPAHFTTKGPGLPILLVFLGPLVSGDMFAAAKLV